MVDALVRACMRTPQAARYIAISKSRLSQLRMTGEGPPFIKIAARPVAYAKIDLYSCSAAPFASSSQSSEARDRSRQTCCTSMVRSRSSTTRGSRTVSTMASAKLCPCATAAKGLRPATPKDFFLSVLDFSAVSSRDGACRDDFTAQRTSLRKGWLLVVLARNVR